MGDGNRSRRIERHLSTELTLNTELISRKIIILTETVLCPQLSPEHHHYEDKQELLR